MTTVNLTGKLMSSCLQPITQINYAYPTSGVGPDSSVAMATRYGLDGPAIKSRWGRDFPHLFHTVPRSHPASCTMGTGFVFRRQRGWVVAFTTHLRLVLKLIKSRVIPRFPLWVFIACSRVTFFFTLLLAVSMGMTKYF
jgi:hypothetical protein